MLTPRHASKWLVLALALLWSVPAFAQGEDATIPYSTFTLDNGLQVVLHQDPTVPLVAVNLNYNVGSSDEPEGRTGFAHLFEHLMFMGTQRVPQGKFDGWMEGAGGWNNAWTSEDRTDYYDVGPKELLETLLWMEADRMEALGNVLGQEQLDLQRDVVRNERRERENSPYGVVWLEISELMYPAGHPYAHAVLGSHEDLVAASVEDIRTFFNTWYAPRNATLVVAGDFEREQAERWIRDYFGGISNPPESETAQRASADFGPAEPKRQVFTDKVHTPRVLFVWRTPKTLTQADAELTIGSNILQEGKASRLYRSLVHGQELATDVVAFQWGGRLESVFMVWATAREGVTVETLEAALSEQVELLRAEGPTEDELQRARAGIEHGFVRALDGVAGRASLLNTYIASVGTPDYIDQDRQRYRDATIESLKATLAEHLDPAHRVTMVVEPEPEPDSTETGEEVEQ
jgi:predicted Zn-dependent peptidase